MLRFFIFTYCILILTCCESSRFEGYSVSEIGVEYKIHTIGEEYSFTKGDVLLNQFTLSTLNDSIISTAENQSPPIFTDRLKTRFFQTLQLLNIGDSATFVLNASDLSPWLEIDYSREVKLHIQLTEKKGKVRYNFEQRYSELLVDYEMKEQEQLFQYLSKLQPDTIERVGGMFIIRRLIGEGLVPSKDNTVTVHYEGFLFDGKKFDSTKDRGNPFTYKIGEQDQVIEGFDIGIRQLREGGKATFIIPSLLAFKSGSSGGIVPPHTSVIYEVELLDIEQ